MPGKIYPSEMEKLLNILTKEEIEMIKADYPFKKARNSKIYELVQRGASPKLLAGLPGGMSQSSIWRIGWSGMNR
jgi:hypothetical protein